MRRLALLLACAALGSGAFACSSTGSSGGGGSDAGGSSDGSASCAPIDSGCGQPCDPGNSLGVGKYCTGTIVCANNGMAPLCSWAGDPTTHFCTFRCSPADAGDAALPTNCGEGASCTCDDGGNCGCTPTKCL